MSEASLTDNDVARLLEAFETEHGAFRIVVGGVSVWRLVRFEMFMRLRRSGLAQLAIPRQYLLDSLRRSAWQYLRLNRTTRYVGKSVNSAMRFEDDGGLVDVYFDHLMDAVPGGSKISSIDSIKFDTAHRHARRQPVFDDTSIYAIAAVLARLAPMEPRGAFAELAQLAQTQLGAAFATADWFRLKFGAFQWRARLYRRVLRRLGARSVLAANSGQFSLHHAARSLRIPFVEMQHGIFSADHPDALPGSALAGADEHSLMIPDALTVYGDYHARLLSTTALAAKGVIVPVGAPLIEIGREVRSRRSMTPGAPPVLTFTSQGMQRESVIRFLGAFLGLVKSPLELKIRLHPGYDSDPAMFNDIAVDPRAEIQLADQAPWTHEQIALSDLHLSISSACHHDAIGIGTPTAVLALPGHDVVNDLVGAGLAPLIRRPEELAQMVEQRAWPSAPRGGSEDLYRPGFSANVASVLASLGVAPLSLSSTTALATSVRCRTC